mgnify:CR=1 FL=1
MTSLPAMHAYTTASPLPVVAARVHVRQRRLAEKPSILDHLTQPLGMLGNREVDIRFTDADVRAIDAHTVAPLGELVIVTGKHGVFIESVEGRHGEAYAWTGKHRAENDCLLLFRHAYGAVTCHLAMNDLGADAHIGFLKHKDFAEVRTFSYAGPRGAMRYERAGFDTVLRYRATQLHELQALVWRGGLLRF